MKRGREGRRGERETYIHITEVLFVGTRSGVRDHELEDLVEIECCVGLNAVDHLVFFLYYSHVFDLRRKVSKD